MPGNVPKKPSQPQKTQPPQPAAPARPVPARPAIPQPPVAGQAPGPIGPQRPASAPPRPTTAQVRSVANPVRPVAPPQRVMPTTPAPAPRPAFRPAGPTPPPPGSSPIARSVPPSPHPAAQPPQTQAVRAAVAGVAAGSARPLAFQSLNTAAAHQTILTEANALQSALADLQQRSAFTDILAEVNDLDSALTRATDLLESARNKGYQFQCGLEGDLSDVSGDWQTVRPQVLDIVNQQAYSFQSRLANINGLVQNLNAALGNPAAATPVLRSTQSQVNAILSNISQLETSLRNRYSSLRTRIDQITTRLTNIHWSLDQLPGAKFNLAQGEALVLAVKARWDKEGKEDPEGVLFASDRRLIFERKEKVATKKVLFITTASELVQEVLIDQAWRSVQAARPENKGLFGHQDFIFVTFSAANLGEVAFHIDGQAAKDWATLVERCRTGQIEADRVLVGDLSVSDLTRPLSAADIAALQNEANQLQDELMLKSSHAELAQLENQVLGLARQLAELRGRGYAIEKGLEGEISILGFQWDRVKANAEATLNSQARLLGDQNSSLRRSLAQLAGMAGNLAAARPIYLQLKSALASAEAQAEAARATVMAQYGQYAAEVSAIAAHLDWVDWMLQALATASFGLLASESGVSATEAVWQAPGLEPENGILYLTDQRWLWEDRVGAYELKVNVPIQAVLDLQKEVDEQDGSESLVATFGPQGPLPQARFHLALPVADEWLVMFNRARRGEYSLDRATPVSPEELERIRNAPQQCNRCGAAFTAPLLRGQTEITCEYCGLVTRI